MTNKVSTENQWHCTNCQVDSDDREWIIVIYAQFLLTSTLKSKITINNKAKTTHEKINHEANSKLNFNAFKQQFTKLLFTWKVHSKETFSMERKTFYLLRWTRSETPIEWRDADDLVQVKSFHSCFSLVDKIEANKFNWTFYSFLIFYPRIEHLLS